MSRIIKLKIHVDNLFKTNNILKSDDIIIFYNDVYQKYFHFNKIIKSSKFIGNIFFAFKFTLFSFDIAFIGLLSNILNLIKLKFSKYNFIAIYGSDKLDQNDLDFRVAHIKSNNCVDFKYLSIISIGSFDHKLFYKNLFKRKNIVFYTDCFSGFRFFYIFYIFFKLRLVKKKSVELYFYLCQNYFVYLMEPFFDSIFKTNKIKKYYCLEINFKNGFSTKIARANNVRTIGFMHGLSFNSYMAHNFIDFLPKENSWIDEFYVWSDFWKDYYINNSSIYRNVLLTNFPRYKNNINYTSNYEFESETNVLWVSEPLIKIDEVIDYLFYLNKNYNLIFKVRSAYCRFYQELIRKHPIFSHNEVRSNNFHLSLKNIHFVIGTHSTAVLESCLYNIKFGVVLTETWGNFFEIEFNELLINNISKLEILLNSEYDSQILETIRLKYFGIKC